MIWIKFIFCSVIIVFAGIRLTKHADLLSERLNLGKVWIGIVLLGLVTSLPEAIACLVSVISLNAANLAVGNLVGSNNFNILLIALMDLFYRQGSLTNTLKPSQSQKMSAIYAIVLSVIAATEIFYGSFLATPIIGTLSIGTTLIALVYLAGMKHLGVLSTMEVQVVEGKQSHDESMNTIYLNLFFSAVLVVVGAYWLTNICDTIAVMTGLGRTFVGTILLACVTSLPEMVVTISALKMGSFDLAIGNIFGSNMINTFIMFLAGIFHRGTTMLSVVSKTHVFTIFLSIVLTIIVMLGVRNKNKKDILGLSWDTIAITVLFLVGTGILYQLR